MPDELNIGAVAESIGNDLFGAGTGGDPPSTGTEDASAVSPPSSNPAVSTPSGVPAPTDFPMPKAWKKEMETHWGTLSPDVKKYIQSREEDVVKGFGQYSTGHKNWNDLVAPFQETLAKYPQVNPVQLAQNLLKNHLAVVNSTPEQRRALVAQIAKGYGVDIGNPAAGGQAPSPQVDPRIDSLESTLRGMIEAQQRAEYEKNLSVVEAFAADPKNRFFPEVADDIMRLLQTGVVKDLQAAYEMAIWSNPAVRAKLIAEQGSGVPAPKIPAPVDVQPTDTGTPAKGKPLTIEDTINSVVRKHFTH